MEIEEFKKRKKKLEEDLHKAISEIVEKFSKETGFYPNKINVDMLCLNEIGKGEYYIVNNVEVDIEI